MPKCAFFIFLSPASNLLYQLPVNQRANPTYGAAPCATIGNNNADKNGIKHNFIVFPVVYLYWTKLLYRTKKHMQDFTHLTKQIFCAILYRTMNNANTILLSKDDKRVIYEIIVAGIVCVCADDTGIDYTVDLPNGLSLTASCDVIAENLKIQEIEYTLQINEVIVASVRMKNTAQLRTPEIQNILDVFQMCSNKIIQQEIRMQQNAMLGKVWQKTIC